MDSYVSNYSLEALSHISMIHPNVVLEHISNNAGIPIPKNSLALVNFLAINNPIYANPIIPKVLPYQITSPTIIFVESPHIECQLKQMSAMDAPSAENEVDQIELNESDSIDKSEAPLVTDSSMESEEGGTPDEMNAEELEEDSSDTGRGDLGSVG